MHGLWSELAKAKGDKKEALSQVDAAISVLTRAIADSQTSDRSQLLRRQRAYRQDRARILQYLYRELELADKEYKKLLEDWHDESDADIDVAVVMRNYAECLRTLANNDVDDPRWEKSNDLLAEAWNRVSDDRDVTLAAEIRYEMARAADIRNEEIEYKQILLDCIKLSEESGHLMLSAIASSRYFGVSDPVHPRKVLTWESGKHLQTA